MTEINLYVRKLWPKSLLMIAEEMGDEIAIALWIAYQGTKVHVPMKIKKNHHLVNLLGIEKAIKLSNQLGKNTLNIPKAHRSMLLLRNFVIRRKRIEEGIAIRDLAIEYKLTERQITTICNIQPVYLTVNQDDILADLHSLNLNEATEP